MHANTNLINAFEIGFDARVDGSGYYHWQSHLHHRHLPHLRGCPDVPGKGHADSIALRLLNTLFMLVNESHETPDINSNEYFSIIST